MSPRTSPHGAVRPASVPSPVHSPSLLFLPPMPSLLNLTVLLSLLAVPVTPAEGAAQDVERYVLAGDAMAVYNLAGRVTIESTDRQEAVVEIQRGGSDADQLSVRVGELDGRESLRVIYPADEIRYSRLSYMSSSSLRVREDGTFGGRDRSGRRVEIQGRGGDIEAHADLRILLPEGAQMEVHQAVGEATVSDVNADLAVHTNSGSIESRATRGRLVLDTGSGHVRVSNAEGDLTVDTGSGAVDLSGIRGDRVLVDTGSGSVEGDNVSATELNVDTGSGGIRVSGVRASRINMDTGSGGIRVELLTDVERAIFDTGSGGVRLTVPRDLGAELEVDVGSGGISVDLPMRVHRKERSYLRATLGDGDGRIEIDTGSGSVRIRGAG